MDQLQTAFHKENFEKVILIFNDLRLETLVNNPITEKIIFKLESKKLFNNLSQFLIKIAKYPLSVLEDELNEGIKILFNNKYEIETLDIIKYCLDNSKRVDEHILSSVVKSCLRTNTNINYCFDLIKQIQSNSNNLSHTFWQDAIDGFSKAKHTSYSMDLIKLYPIKFSYSENLWRLFIKNNMNDDQVMDIFKLWTEKYEKRTIHDEFKYFENIYNIFLEELTLCLQNIDHDKTYKIFDVLIRQKIQLRETILENFLIKIIKSNLNNFEKVQSYLIKSDNFLTSKIIQKIIIEYSKSNDNFAIFNIIKLCKSKKIQIPFHMLNIDSKVMKNLVQFMLENTKVSFEESFCESLSFDNKSYLQKNNSLISKQKSKAEIFNIKEEDQISEKNDFDNSELAESKSFNSKSFVKVDMSEHICFTSESNGFVIIK